MPRNRRKERRQLELSDRDYNALRRRLEDLRDAETRAERREAEQRLEALCDRLEVDDDLVDALIAGDVELEDDDDGERSTRRRRDDDDRGRSRRRRSSGRDDDDDEDDDDEDDDDEDDDEDDGGGKRGGATVRSLRELRERPSARAPRRRREDTKPETPPEQTHWMGKPVIRRGEAAGGAK